MIEDIQELLHVIFDCIFGKCVVLKLMYVLYIGSLQKYYHGESIAVNVLVDNNTNKSVKKIKISGEFWVLGLCDQSEVDLRGTKSGDISP